MTLTTAKKCEIANKILKALTDNKLTSDNFTISIELTKGKADVKNITINQ